MSRQTKVRLALAMLLAWSCAAWLAGTARIPETVLVGQRPPRSWEALVRDFTPPDVSGAAKTLEGVILWGILRDGNPLPTPANPEEVRKKVEWQLVAAAIRPKERYILIRVAQGAPVPIKEGEDLPDGSRLMKIGPKSITLLTPEGKKRSLPIYAD